MLFENKNTKYKSFKAKHPANTLKGAELIKLIFIQGLSPQLVKVSKGWLDGLCPRKSRAQTNKQQPCATLVQQKRLDLTQTAVFTQKHLQKWFQVTQLMQSSDNARESENKKTESSSPETRSNLHHIHIFNTREAKEPLGIQHQSCVCMCACVCVR